MQRCPKCGYQEGTDWPWFLSVAAVTLLYIAFIYRNEPTLKESSRWMGLAAYLFFLAATTWRGLREKRNRKEYEKLHPPITERIKAHNKPGPVPGQ